MYNQWETLTAEEYNRKYGGRCATAECVVGFAPVIDVRTIDEIDAGQDSLVGGFSAIGSGGVYGGVRAFFRGIATRVRWRSLIDQADDLVGNNGGKNRVTLRSPSCKIEVDLAGKAHGGVPAPHTKVSPRNLNAPNQPAYNTKGAAARAATQQDIRMIRKYLKR